VIEAEASAAGVTVTGVLPPGSAAYIDADWVPAGRGGACPGVVATPDGQLQWSRGPGHHPAAGVPDTCAALTLVAVAREVTEAIRGAEAVRVRGSGAVARLIRDLVPSTESNTTVDAVVDTTGDLSVLAEEFRRVADLGTIVLAGELLDGSVDLDLYPDVHRRGLRVVGVAPPLTSGIVDNGEPLPDWLLPSLCPVAVGDVLPAGAPWYRVRW
jgi:hypothetical protein